jgi:copper transport protein
VALLVSPHALLAHAHLRRSDPRAGATVPAPRVIRLWFTEAPELSLTVVRIVDSAGAAIAAEPPSSDPDGALAVRVRLIDALKTGRYTVTWRTAASDGHPSSGSFTFRVEQDTAAPVATPAMAPRSEPARSTRSDSATAALRPVPPDAGALTPLYVVARALSYAALLALLGAVAFRFAVVPRLRQANLGATGAAPAMLDRLAFGAAAAALTYLVTAGLRLALQDRMMTGDALLDGAHMRAMTMETHWGAIWRLQLGAGAAALLGALGARRRPAGGWTLVAAASGALALAAALSGHAAAQGSLRTLSVIDDALHVVGAAGWLGSLLWLVGVGLADARSWGPQRAARVAALVNAYSPTALAFAALVAVTGVVSAWLRLGSVAALWTSSYGQVLLVKLAFLACVTATGFYNWRRVRPALGTDEATVRLRRSATAELLIGLAVVAATAVLVAMPTPV